MATKAKKNTQLMFSEEDINTLEEFQQSFLDWNLSITKVGLLRASLLMIMNVYYATNDEQFLKGILEVHRNNRPKRKPNLKKLKV